MSTDLTHALLAAAVQRKPPRRRPRGMILRRRTALAAAVALVVASLAGCSARTFLAGDGRWDRLPDPPVSARLGAVGAWTGREVVFLGGDASTPCPPAADCARSSPGERDGAAWDAAAGTWRVTAPAPVPVPAFAPSAVVAGVVFVLTPDGLVAYDAAADSWARHELPPGVDGGQLTANGIRLVLSSGERTDRTATDQEYDLVARTWSPLPPDPLAPAFDRVLVATPHGLVLTGQDLVENPGSAKPSLTRAAVLPPGQDRWTLLPDSDQLGSGPWAWTGRRLVSVRLDGADGGEVNPYGRTIPYGGVLDPAAGRWSRLPDAPKAGSGGWPVSATGGPVTASEGWVYDDRDESWTRIVRPDGAPGTPGTAVWAGDALVVLGGVDQHGDQARPGTLSRGAWLWRAG